VREKTISWTESSMQDDCSSSVCPESNAIFVAVVTEDVSNYAEEMEALSTRVSSLRDDTRIDGSECVQREVSRPTKWQATLHQVPCCCAALDAGVVKP
jgi:hypothetical protein